MANNLKTIQYCEMCDAPVTRNGICKRCSPNSVAADKPTFVCCANENNVRCRSDKKLMRINPDEPARFFCDYHFQKYIAVKMHERRMLYYRNREATLTDLHPDYAKQGGHKETRAEAQATAMRDIIEKQVPGYSDLMKRIN